MVPNDSRTITLVHTCYHFPAHPCPLSHLLAPLAVVVVGRSNIVGRPMAQLCRRRSATVTVAHSRTTDLPAVCRTADVLVVAVGQVCVCTHSLQHTAHLFTRSYSSSPHATPRVLGSPHAKREKKSWSPNYTISLSPLTHALLRSLSPIRPVLTPARSSSCSRAWCRRTGSNRARW